MNYFLLILAIAIGVLLAPAIPALVPVVAALAVGFVIILVMGGGAVIFGILTKNSRMRVLWWVLAFICGGGFLFLFLRLVISSQDQGAILPALAMLAAIVLAGWQLPRQLLIAKAGRGNALAQIELGSMYGKGQGFRRNFKKAYVWCALAAANGIEEAENFRDANAAKLSPEQLAAARQEVAEIQASPRYSQGCSPEEDAKAAEQLRLAAGQGDAQAQNKLGLSYSKGKGVAHDYAQALKWYRSAAEQGLAVAQYNLGQMYANGRGVEQNDATAAKYWLLAAGQGFADAQFRLGVCYNTGKGIARNDIEAYIWYFLAVEYGNKEALAYRDEVAQALSDADLSDARHEAKNRHIKIQSSARQPE